MAPQLRNRDAHADEVVLVLNAGTDAGHRLARALLDAGYLVAVTDRHAGKLARILHGYSASQVFAIAADSAGLELLVDRVQQRFAHPVSRIVDAADQSSPRGVPSPSTSSDMPWWAGISMAKLCR